MLDTRATICAHCGEPAVGSEQPAFCCSGCKAAYELIHGWGLDNFYKLRDQSSTSLISKETVEDSRFLPFDSEAFLGDSSPQLQSDGKMTTQLAIHGLHCSACAWLIENAAQRTTGWNSARVRLNDHTIRIVFDPKLIQLSQIARLVSRIGYELAPLSGTSDDHILQENRRLLIQIAIAGFCAANAMWIAIALYAGEASGVLADHRYFLRLMGTGLGIVAVAFPGRTFFVGALASLRTRTPHMDLPVALGLAVGTIAGSVGALLGKGEVYFDSLAILVFLLLVGRWVRFRQQHRAAKAVDLLLRITPRHAKLKTGPNQYTPVLADTLKPKDVVRVDAGQSIPVDGTVLGGQSLVDRSLLTGESKPVPVSVDDQVAAGTVNISQSIDVSTMAVGPQSRIGRVMKSVEDAMASRVPVVQLADRIGGWFVVVVTALACLTVAIWWGSGWSIAASHATSLLIVACPCALALATPLAVAIALGRSAQRRIMIRDGGTFQLLADKGQIWFDKTGTLTEGRVTARHLWGCKQAIRLAAIIERECCHPVADAILQCAEMSESDSQDVYPDQPTKVEFGGVTGKCEGKIIGVGNVEFMNRRSVAIDDACAAIIQETIAAGRSPVLISVGDRAVTLLEISDPIKADAAETVSRLRRIGWKVGILSGDQPETVSSVATSIGIESSDGIGGLSPEEKLEMVRNKSTGRVVMIGDGANDAAALAAADVGIAIKGGAEVSLQAAPVFISSGHLASIVELICASQRTNRLIQAAFVVSISYNIVAVALAMAGWITPLIAAVLMPLSSVSVLTMTLAWPIFGETKS